MIKIFIVLRFIKAFIHLSEILRDIPRLGGVSVLSSVGPVYLYWGLKGLSIFQSQLLQTIISASTLQLSAPSHTVQL